MTRSDAVLVSIAAVAAFELFVLALMLRWPALRLRMGIKRCGACGDTVRS